MKPTEDIAIIVYGDGGELGNFKVFADNLKRDLDKTYKNVIMKYVNRDYEFFKLLDSVLPIQKIKELHVFSHAIGAGLFLGYKDNAISAQRINALRTADLAGRKLTYNEVVAIEKGAIQTDDLLHINYLPLRNKYRNKFTKGAFIKIWGCNSGVDSWVYSDQGLVDPADTREWYYWRAFNEKNTPKPSIAKAMAKYFNVTVYGAKSGASIEVYHKGAWVSSQSYKKNVGHWPSGRLPHRLVPDKGTYHAFNP